MRSGPNTYPSASERHRTPPRGPWDDLGSPDIPEATLINTAGQAYQKYLEDDTPGRPWQKIAKRQINPTFAGAFTTIAFMAISLADVAANGPSSFVLAQPELAAAALTAGAATAGAATSKLIGEANATELKAVRQAERANRRAEQAEQDQQTTRDQQARRSRRATQYANHERSNQW